VEQKIWLLLPFLFSILFAACLPETGVKTTGEANSLSNTNNESHKTGNSEGNIWVLLSLAAGTKFVVNGLALLAAVLVDAVSRRSREA